VDSKSEAVDFLDAVVPRMRLLGVAEFTFGDHAVKLGATPAEAAPAPPPRNRMSAVELAIAGPPIEPQYANPDAKPASK